MNVVRWDPFRLLIDQATRLDGEEGHRAWLPPVDIFQAQDNLVLRAEVPGVDKDNIDVRVENGVLTLQGDRKTETDLDDKNAFRRERIFGRFARSFTLPTTVDAATSGAPAAIPSASSRRTSGGPCRLASATSWAAR